MTAPPNISVIVCTRDRPDDLRKALESIADQDFDSYEVLVVDQSRADDTRRVVEQAAQGRDFLRYVRLSTPGLSRAYNAGIASSRGDLLAFTDDDCEVPRDWLRFIDMAFAVEPDVALLYGQVLLPARLLGKEGQEGVTPQLPIEARRRLSRSDGFRVFGMGANFAARRSACMQLGGFDEVLGGGGPLQSAQDFDFAYRLFRKGFAILLEPTVIVYHHGFRTLRDWPAVVRSYGVGVGGFYWKHVRAGDAYAARLLAAMLARETAGVMRKVLLRRPAGIQWKYLTSVFAGIVRSHGYHIDRRRLYHSRQPAGMGG